MSLSLFFQNLIPCLLVYLSMNFMEMLVVKISNTPNRCKKHKICDIFPSLSHTSLMQYFNTFSNKKEVRYFTMDMNHVYRYLVKDYFPNATIVIDKFHVVRYASWALKNVRKRNTFSYRNFLILGIEFSYPYFKDA